MLMGNNRAEPTDFWHHLIPLAANELGPRIPSANLSEVSAHERVCVCVFAAVVGSLRVCNLAAAAIFSP